MDKHLTQYPRTQVKMEDAPRLLRIPKSQCPHIWVRPPRHEWPKSRTMKIQWFFLNEVCTDTRWRISCVKDNSSKFCRNWNWKKIPNWKCLLVHRQQGPFSSKYNGTTTQWLEGNRIWRPSGRKLMKNVDLDAPTSILVDVHMGCKPNENIIEKYKEMFESSISARVTEKLPRWEKPHAKTVAWSYDLEGHAQKTCVERYCEVANKKTKQLYKVSSPCLDDHQIKKEELESVGEFSKVCTQIVLKCLYLARIGGPDILMASRQTCPISHRLDRNLWQALSKLNIIHSSYRWLPTVLPCGEHSSALSIGFIPRLSFCWRPWGPKINLGRGSCVFLEAEHLSPLAGCARSKLQCHTVLQNLKSFRWMLDCEWWITCSRFMGCGDRSVAFNKQHFTCRKLFARHNQTQTKRKRKPRCWSIVWCGLRSHKYTSSTMWVSAAYLWGQRRRDQNESSKAEVQQWDTCQEPTELLLVGCVTEFTWTPKIQIKYVDIKSQLTDMLTKWSFTLDEWNHLLRLLNIMNFLMFSCSHFFLSNG